MSGDFSSFGVQGLGFLRGSGSRPIQGLSAAEAADSGLEDNAGFRPRLVASGKRQAPACQCESPYALLAIYFI